MLKRTIWYLPLICAFGILAAAAQGTETSAANSPEKAAILKALNAPVSKDLKQQISVSAEVFRVEGDWAFVSGQARNPRGGAPNWKPTKYQALIDSGDFEDNLFALLKKNNGGWRVLTYMMSCQDVCYIGWDEEYKAPKALFENSSTGFAQPQTTEVKIYMVARDDAGKNGKKVGCDDSLVAVTRKIASTPAPLKAALLELFADREPSQREIDLNLGNYWRGMQLKSVSIENGTAIIHLTGEEPRVAGICDYPRITEQLIETAKQFPTVKKVKVFINGKAMNKVISPV